jgi:hypothetical protein
MGPQHVIFKDSNAVSNKVYSQYVVSHFRYASPICTTALHLFPKNPDRIQTSLKNDASATRRFMKKLTNYECIAFLRRRKNVILKTRFFISYVVNFYNVGVVTRDRRIGYWSFWGPFLTSSLAPRGELNPGPRGEIWPLGGVFAPSFTPRGEHSLLLFRRMEGRTEFYPHGIISPLWDKIHPWGTFAHRGEVKNRPAFFKHYCWVHESTESIRNSVHKVCKWAHWRGAVEYIGSSPVPPARPLTLGCCSCCGGLLTSCLRRLITQ